MSLDRLPENALPVELKQRRAEAAELKGSFQAFGSGSVRTHRIFSDSPFDVQLTASATPGTRIFHQVAVEFIPDDMTFGGAFCYRVYAVPLDLSNALLPNLGIIMMRQRSTDGTQRWFAYYVSEGGASSSIRLKFYFLTTGSGTFTGTVIT